MSRTLDPDRIMLDVWTDDERSRVSTAEFLRANEDTPSVLHAIEAMYRTGSIGIQFGGGAQPVVRVARVIESESITA